uniref:Protein kinase domain-containing protein n=1 Tax=Ditylenchus dipsaci TaxID=166011 RepID=A0A915ESD2_9BILA
MLFICIFNVNSCWDDASRKYFGDLIQQHKKNFAKKANLLVKVLLAIEAMHVIGICHNDISEENILIDENLHVKIIDYGEVKQEECSDPTDLTKAVAIFKPSVVFFLTLT